MGGPVSREIRTSIPAWQIARTAAVEMNLDHGAEMKLRSRLEKVTIVLAVENDGSAVLVGAENIATSGRTKP